MKHGMARLSSALREDFAGLADFFREVVPGLEKRGFTVVRPGAYTPSQPYTVQAVAGTSYQRPMTVDQMQDLWDKVKGKGKMIRNDRLSAMGFSGFEA